MADLIQAKLIGSKELQRRLDKMNPSDNARITTPALLESMQVTLTDAAQNQIVRSSKGPVRADKLTSRSGDLRRSLTSNFAIQVNGRLRFVDGGSHYDYAAIHENSRRAFLKPALKATGRQHEAIFVKHWARAGQVT